MLALNKYDIQITLCFSRNIGKKTFLRYDQDSVGTVGILRNAQGHAQANPVHTRNWVSGVQTASKIHKSKIPHVSKTIRNQHAYAPV